MSLKGVPCSGSFAATLGQSDQMVRIFYNIWPLAIMIISPIMSQICQSRLSILPNRKQTVKNLPRTCKLLPKWRNFAKSGHTAWGCDTVSRQTLVRTPYITYLYLSLLCNWAQLIQFNIRQQIVISYICSLERTKICK